MCNDSDYGEVTTDKTVYQLGDTVHLKVTANPGCYLDSLKINGKKANVAADGTYSFVATEDTYNVSADFIALFYSNEKKADIADPFVLDNSSVDGYYYMYGTKGTRTGYCYRSTNLMDWEEIGDAIDKNVSDEIKKVLNADIWAPEVVFDKNTQTYYMFFSATPHQNNTSTDVTAMYVMMVATSKSPDKDFKLVDFSDLDNSRSEYSEYFAKYLYFNPDELSAFCKSGNEKTYSDTLGKYIPAIDPHPYEDETGKYLFWVDQDGDDRICAVKMKDDNWLTPDWDTATVLTYAHYYTRADFLLAKQGHEVELAKYDFRGSNNRYVNEAPAVIKHDGKYYLTYSSGRYATNSYRVIQAVAEPDVNGGPLGVYEKMEEKDGAILLSSSRSGNKDVTGTGHHSFVTVGDKVYMVYHRHDDTVNMGDNRNPAIDEVKWIANSNGLDVLYVNGPTCTFQPRLDVFSEFTNIADEATVRADLVNEVNGTMNFVHEYDGTEAKLSTKTKVLGSAVTDLDLTLTTKRHTELLNDSEKFDILLDFENGKNLSFYLGMVNGSWSISNLNRTNEDNIYIRDQKIWYTLTNDERITFTNESLNFRIVRSGTNVSIYLGGKYIATADLTNNFSGVTAETLITSVTVRHYGTPNKNIATGDIAVDIPYEISTTPKVSYLTDGFLSVSNITPSDVVDKVGETTITENTTFTFDFDSARDVRAIMVYNSKKRSTIFTNISKIELVCVEYGVEVTRTIENVAFNSEYYTDDYVTPGAAAYTEFACMNVKSVKITVDVPEGQVVGISEVRILGK